MAVDAREDRPRGPEVLHSRPQTARLRWWHEVLLIAVGYAIYTLIRNSVPSHDPRAKTNARRVESFEKSIGVFHEHALNNWLAPHEALATVANYWYATAHFTVTIGVAVWILWKHPRHARPLRIAWYSMNVVALFGYYFFPLAPPRLMPGFVDTIDKYGIWGAVGDKANADGASNQFAAMPSMHIGWSTWSAVVIVVFATSWWVKALGALYPLITLLAIVGTANHYFLDAFGGLVALAIGFGVAQVLTGHNPFAPEPAVPVPEPAG